MSNWFGSRLLGRLALGVLLVLGAPASGTAASLSAATLQLNLQGLPGAEFVGTLSGSAISAGNVTIGSSFPTGASTASPTNPATVTNVVVTINGNGGGGTFLGSGTGQILVEGGPEGPGNLRGMMPVSGVAKVRGLGQTLLPVPLAAGAPGTQILTGAGIALTVINASWTANTGGVTGVPFSTTIFLSYTFHAGISGVGSTIMQSGNFPLTNKGTPIAATSASNVFTIVAPTKVVTSLAASPIVPSFAILSVHIVPEPGTMLLFGAGALVMLALGRGRS
jgi:hypothetical protein